MLCGLSIIRKAIANDNYGCGSRKVWPTLKSTRYGEAALHCYLAEFRLEEATEGIGGFLVVTGSKQEAISPIVRRLGNSTYLVSVYRFLSSGSERIKDLGQKVLVAGILGTSSGQLRSGSFVDFPCKRHQQKHLVFLPTCFASRGPRVRVPPRPPTFFISR